MATELFRTSNNRFLAHARAAAEHAVREIKPRVDIADRLNMQIAKLQLNEVQTEHFENQRFKCYWDYLHLRTYGAMTVTIGYRYQTIWDHLLRRQGKAAQGLLSGQEGSFCLELSDFELHGPYLAQAQVTCRARINGFWFPRNMQAHSFPPGTSRPLSELLKTERSRLQEKLSRYSVQMRPLRFASECVAKLPEQLGKRPVKRLFLGFNANEVCIMDDD